MELFPEKFEWKLNALRDFAAEKTIAAGVSGGPDSMAMLWLLNEWAQKHNVRVQAYTVDHGLREESATEAAEISGWVSGWTSVRHRVLRWEGVKPRTRILEEARAARYALMADAMRKDGAKSLFIAHHQDDQAETFLIRLAKGSGLDGLACMRALQIFEDDLTLVRPLLDFSKEDLVSMCRDNNIAYADDPTNKNERYLRPRLRAAKDILEEEGLSAKRLAATASRLARARAALEDMSRDLFTRALLERRKDGFLFDYKALRAGHEELVLRVIQAAMEELRPGNDYAPRMERLENLMHRILKDGDFNGATLGGCLFAPDRENETVWIGKE